jgi:hypothetical protein
MASYDFMTLRDINHWIRLLDLGILVASFSFGNSPATIAITATTLFAAGFILNAKQTLHVFLSVIVPFAIATSIVALIASPTAASAAAHSLNSRADVSWQAYAFRFIKISGVCISVSLLIGCLSPRGFYRWLVCLGVPSEIAMNAASPLVLIQALGQDAKTILNARLVQGHVRRRNFFLMAKQLLPVLTTLVSSGLMTALERSEIWNREDILSLIEKDIASVRRATPGNWFASSISLVLALLVSTVNIFWHPTV